MIWPFCSEHSFFVMALEAAGQQRFVPSIEKEDGILLIVLLD